MHLRTRIAAVAAVGALSAAALAGCAPSSDDSAGPVHLTYWDWAPGVDKLVDQWNDENPDIQVDFVKVVGAEAPTKFLTAIEAGSGAPDIFQAEFQAIPTFVSNNALADISSYIPSGLKDQFADATWNQVTLGSDAVYGLPQNTGLMVFYYRQDVFEKYGLSVPTTWDEYAETARALHAAAPDTYLGTFSSKDPGWFRGVTQQAGGSWWSVDGDTWGVDIDSDAAQDVASYWGGLVQEGAIDNQPFFTPAWNAAMTDGTMAGWISGAWGGAILAGSAPDAAGKWAVAPIPQWDASQPATGTWGGATLAVTTQSTHPKEATEFIQWVTSTEAGLNSLIAATGGLYPSDLVNGPKVLTEAPAYFPNQPDYWKVISSQADTIQNATYGPNTNVADSAYIDEFGKAVEARSSSAFLDALTAVQKTTLDDLKATGFTVK